MRNVRWSDVVTVAVGGDLRLALIGTFLYTASVFVRALRWDLLLRELGQLRLQRCCRGNVRGLRGQLPAAAPPRGVGPGRLPETNYGYRSSGIDRHGSCGTDARRADRSHFYRDRDPCVRLGPNGGAARVCRHRTVATYRRAAVWGPVRRHHAFGQHSPASGELEANLFTARFGRFDGNQHLQPGNFVSSQCFNVSLR